MTFTPETLDGLDALIFRGGKVRQPFASLSDDPAQRCLALQEALQFVNPDTDSLFLAPGDFDWGQTKIVLPSSSNPKRRFLINGCGAGITRWLGSAMIDTIPPGTTDYSQVQWALGNTWLNGLSLLSYCINPQEDGTATGFNTSQPGSARISGCEIFANDWPVYSWSAGNTLLIEDSDVTSGRTCIAAEDSGPGQDFTVRRCRLYGDASLSKSVGASSNPVIGIVCGVMARGGPMRVRDTDIFIKGGVLTGPSYCPRACGISDFHAAESAGNTLIEIWNTRCSVDPNGADPSKCFDLELRASYTQESYKLWPDAGGSEKRDGTWKKNF